jgi:hypothetical protein
MYHAKPTKEQTGKQHDLTDPTRKPKARQGKKEEEIKN